MKTRMIQRATPEDLRRLDAAEQWAAELDQATEATETRPRGAAAAFKQARKAPKTAQKLKAQAPKRLVKQ